VPGLAGDLAGRRPSGDEKRTPPAWKAHIAGFLGPVALKMTVGVAVPDELKLGELAMHQRPSPETAGAMPTLLCSRWYPPPRGSFGRIRRNSTRRSRCLCPEAMGPEIGGEQGEQALEADRQGQPGQRQGRGARRPSQPSGGIPAQQGQRQRCRPAGPPPAARAAAPPHWMRHAARNKHHEQHDPEDQRLCPGQGD